ncbi:RING-H2 finger protein ATL32 [Zea mays]|uniref:RING-type E3 ubiquitin transferase n=1 Tax=Zea mays TaxID=4577 RepID=A0A3L6D8V5_MAIZE|nr:RING-H2 finger protein ATL32 [Zea mays]
MSPPPSSPPRTLAISLAVSLLFVSAAIVLVTATTVFMLCCRRRRDGPGPSSSPVGIDAEAIRSLPAVETTLRAFSYAPQDGEHGGSALECAVCLGAVKEGEMVRQLAACKHVYHVECIDRWLAAHQTCPVCRSIAA